MDLGALGKSLVVVGALTAAAGALLLVLARTGIPRLPGDLSFRVGPVHVYAPIATSIVVSIVLTLLLNLLLRGR